MSFKKRVVRGTGSPGGRTTAAVSTLSVARSAAFWRLFLIGALMLGLLMVFMFSGQPTHAQATTTPGATTPAAATTPAPAPAGDPGGLSTGSGSDLNGIAPFCSGLPGGCAPSSDNDKSAQKTFLDTAAKNEPYATNLANMVRQNQLGVNYVWTLVAGFLVMLMQLGFALVETGFCRYKNAFHVMGMNFAVYFIGMLGYYIAGFAFQFGGIGNVGVSNLGGLATLNNEIKIGDWGIIGGKGFFLTGDTYDVGIAVMFLFQMVFMDTTATIPTGAMAERWKWSSFVIYGFFVSMIIYPIYGNWAWGGGWLSQLGTSGPLGSGSPFGAGYVDFAGSGVVHAIGGWTALAGAIVLGPRLGKYNKDGSSNPVPGHNMILAITGTIILAFGWFGFNPGSTLGASGGGNLRIGLIAVVTMLAGSAGGMTAMVITWIQGKRPDVGMTCNGLLAGLVAITAPSGYVEPVGAIIIGIVAGGLVVFFVGVVDRVFHIDDPVGAISVHGVNGMWGQLAVGLFADGKAQYLSVTGLFYGGGINQLLAQAVGAVVALVWAFGISFVFFKVLGLILGGNRVSEKMELDGLDDGEMVQPGYMDSDPLADKWPLPAAPVGVPA
ncbi:MAG TPA: ammonium transporter [Chloroflexia bacterium]|nr:ammonium transporter [Chloroflexia bacterium]